MAHQGKITAFMGAKGGVGCSTLSSLLARLAAKRENFHCAFVDASPAAYSPIPSFLSIPSPGHCLAQLAPYRDHLSRKVVESFFPKSPEELAYIPLHQNDDSALPLEEALSLLEKLRPWFDCLFLDLSSFPDGDRLRVLERSNQSVLVSSFDPLSLSMVKNWQKRLLAHHLDMGGLSLLFNNSQAGQIPSEAGSLVKGLAYLGDVPFLGADLSMNLLKLGSLSAGQAKALGPILEKILAFKGVEKADVPPTEGSTAAEAPLPVPEPAALEQIHELHQRLLGRLRASGLMGDAKNSEIRVQELAPKAREILDELIQEIKVSDRESRKRLVTETMNLAFGLGPLEPLLGDAEITEIMVNGPDQVYVEKKGLLEKTQVRFVDDQQLRTILERILAPLGRRIDDSQPYVDGRLSDGSRVNAVIPPLSLGGPTLTIRKFSKRKLTADDLIRLGSLSTEAASFLGACVKARKNIVVSGGTGSGKTTLLNILSNFIPSSERIVTIEDSAELQLAQDHVVRLESRPANLEGQGKVSIRDLVINALRMRPDRIVVGEVRGGEALDMLQAMNTGHDGSLTTAHANSPRDVVSRLETMCLFAGLELPLKAIREQIARAVHLVVQQNRLSDGKRKVTQITEVQGMEGDAIMLQDIFVLEDGKGLSRKSFAPSFLADLKAVGYNWPGHEK